MEKEKTKLSKIMLKVEGKELSLTPDAAKELYAILGELYGDKTVYLPSQPIVIKEYPSWPKTIWWGSPVYCSSGSKLSADNNGPYELNDTLKLSLKC